jgi:hypothetical protein
LPSYPATGCARQAGRMLSTAPHLVNRKFEKNQKDKGVTGKC